MRQRPISVTVFGILNIGFGVLNFFGLLFSVLISHLKLPGNSGLSAIKSDPSYTAWSHFSPGVSVLLGIILIASGIGLLLLQNWARVLSFIYAVLRIAEVLVGAAIGHRVMMQAVTSQAHGVPPAMIAAITLFSIAVGIVIGLAYPVLVLIFMTRPKFVEPFNPPPAQEPH